MSPYKVNLWVYAENDAEAQALQQELNQFVTRKYNQGVYVRAGRLASLLNKYGDSAIVNAYIK